MVGQMLAQVRELESVMAQRQPVITAGGSDRGVAATVGGGFVVLSAVAGCAVGYAAGDKVLAPESVGRNALVTGRTDNHTSAALYDSKPAFS